MALNKKQQRELEENRGAVEDYFLYNPDDSLAKAAKELGLAVETVNRHRTALIKAHVLFTKG